MAEDYTKTAADLLKGPPNALEPTAGFGLTLGAGGTIEKARLLAVDPTDGQVLTAQADGSMAWETGSNAAIGETTIAYRSVDQTPTQATDTAIQLNAELRDDLNGHDNLTNNTRISVPRYGVYLVTWLVIFKSGTGTGYESAWARISNSGGTPLGIMAKTRIPEINQTITGAEFNILAAGEFLELMVNVSSNGAGQTVAFARMTVCFIRA